MTGSGTASSSPGAPHGDTRRWLRSRESIALLALLILGGVVSLASPYFLTSRNLFNVLQGMSTIGIMSIGMTIVLVAGGLDLSVGSIMAVGAVLTARLMTYQQVDPWLSALCGIGAGVLFGWVNGLLVTRVRVIPFIATLGTLSIGRGLAFLLAVGGTSTVASNVPMRDRSVGYLGAGYLGPVPVSVVIMLLLVAIASVLLANTVRGREVHAVGSNLRASRLSGIDVDAVQRFTYLVSGGLAALAGVMSAGLLGSAPTGLGQGIELDVIAATVIGGTSLQGGEGTAYGAILGAAIMAVVRNAFVLVGLPLHFQTMIIGAVILLAVGLDRVRTRDA